MVNLMGPSAREEAQEVELYFLRTRLTEYLAWLKEEQGDFMAGSGYTKMALRAEKQLRAVMPERILGRAP